MNFLSRDRIKRWAKRQNGIWLVIAIFAALFLALFGLGVENLIGWNN